MMAQVEEAVGVAGEPGQNPLDNPLILEHVFSFLSSVDLGTCRNVSKFWRAHALKTWRSNTTVALAPGNKGSKLGKFMTFVNRKYYQDSGVPYTKFSLTGNAKLSNFWDICAAHINILKLEKIAFQNADHFRLVIFQHCSNMRELTLLQVSVKQGVRNVREPVAMVELQYPRNLSLERFTTDSRTGMLGISWMELLGQFPSMKVLTLDGHEESVSFGPLFQSAMRIRQLDSTKLTLKEIRALYLTNEYMYSRPSLPSDGKRDLIRFVVESNLQLDSVSVRVGKEDDGLHIWQILSAQATTLKQLTVTSTFTNFNRVNTSPHPDFLRQQPNASYQKLEEIKLDKVSTSLEFLRYVPNLKKLDLTVFAIRDEDNMIRHTPAAAMAGVQLENCTDSKLDVYPDSDVSLEDIEKLSAWLPNVKNLSVACVVENELFALICFRWPELVELKIFGYSCQVDECGFTGLDGETVTQVNAGEQVDIEGNRSGNISWLQSLKRVFLVNYNDTSVLGRVSYLYGFGQLPNLEHLEMNGYEFEPAELWEPVLRYRKLDM